MKNKQNKQKQEASAHDQKASFEWSKSRNSSTDSKFVQQCDRKKNCSVAFI